jgi:serine/threonine protein kinase/tetratricopeptide (TPR) repeat protein
MTEREIFEQALDVKDPAERASYLDRACADQPELRRQVEQLLRAHEVAGPFLDQPHPAAGAVEGTGPYASPETPGTVIAGKYKLLQQIGEGGMGSVWMADQLEPVKRRVAVKLIRTEREGSRTILSRFEAERQAIALMDHPNIAKLLDAGTTGERQGDKETRRQGEGAGASVSLSPCLPVSLSTERPYFVMELVKGVPLTTFCDEHRLSIPERLNLFTQICGAVQHAHQKGIIHRDLKPTNILVEMHDNRPVPRVIDFGLAKALSGQPLTEHTLFTGFGMVAGTPLYMAPEQAKFNAIDIDTRADIYALGVILYELLTGSTPIERAVLKQVALDEILRVIRESEPPTPSKRLSSTESKPSVAANRQSEPQKLGRFVRGELDWIVMKALAKERDRRYETANGFAKDVERFLNHEPVSAGPPTVRYKFRKFVRRNKAQVVAGSLVLLALLLGITGTTFGLIRAESRRLEAEQARAAERDRAEGERQARQEALAERDAKAKALVAEEKARQAEKKARDQAIAALRQMTDDVVEKQLARAPTLTDENRAFLRKIIEHFNGLAAITADDADSRLIRLEGFYRVGRMRQRLGELREAEAAYVAGLAINKQLAADFPARPEFRWRLAMSHHSLGNLLRDTGRLKEAEAAYSAAQAILKPLVAEFPTRREVRLELATTHNSRAVLLQTTGQLKEAEAAHRDALALLKQLVADFPARAEFRRQLAGSYNNLGVLLRGTGRFEAAEAAHRDALAIDRQLAADFPTRPDYLQALAGSQENLGNVFRESGRWREAEAAYSAALALRKQLAADYPSRPEFRRELAGSHNNLGIVHGKMGRFKEAEAAHAGAAAVLKQLVADFPTRQEIRRELAASHGNLFGVLHATGRSQEAEVAANAALALFKQLAVDFPSRPEFREDLAKGYNNLGDLLRHTGRRREAEAAHAEALAIRKQLAADFPSRPDFRRQLAGSLNNLGGLFGTAGRLKEAEAAFVEALSVFKQLVTEFPTRVEFRLGLATSHNNLGGVHLALGRLKDAEAAYLQALTVRKQLSERFPNVPDLRNDVAATLANLSLSCNQRREFRTAKKYLDEAMLHHRAALDASPRNPAYRLSYRTSLTALVAASAGLRDRPAALRAAEKIRDLGWDAPGDAYNAACALSLCIPIVRKDEEATREDRDKGVEFYGVQAMAMLRHAVSKGFKDVAHMEKDTDLDSLRGREDFKKLVAEWTGGKGGGKE